MIDHSVLHPNLTDVDLERVCKFAIEYDVVLVCVIPYVVRKTGATRSGATATIVILEEAINRFPSLKT